MTAKYKGKQIKFLIPSHEYEVYFVKLKGYYVYNCHVVYDLTKGEEIDSIVDYASEISIKNNWEINGKILDKD